MAIGTVGRVARADPGGLGEREEGGDGGGAEGDARTGWTTALRDIIRACPMRTRAAMSEIPTAYEKEVDVFSTCPSSCPCS